MKVEVCLFATLATYLPPGATGDRAIVEMPDGATVADVLRALEIPETVECLRVVNGHDAPLSQVLREGDVLTLFPPLAGGLA